MSSALMQLVCHKGLYLLHIYQKYVITSGQDNRLFIVMMKSKERLPNFNPSAFIHLKQYPNKAILSRCKVITFKHGSLMFEQRCSLFTQLCYLLIKAESDNTTLYLSRNMLISNHHRLFMVYSCEDKYKDRLKGVNCGQLIFNLIQYYLFVFNQTEGEFQDQEFQKVRENSEDYLQYLRELQDKSEGQYLQTDDGPIHKTILSTTQALLHKLQQSLMFQEYSYRLKWNTAALIPSLVYRQHKQLLPTYHELLEVQSTFQRSTERQQRPFDLQPLHYLFHQHLYNLFKLLQSQNHLRISSIEEEPSPKQSHHPQTIQIFAIEFTSNLKQLQELNYTLQSNSSQSSAQINQENRDSISNRIKQYNQILQVSKNQTNFKVKIQYQQEHKYFILGIEAQSQWVLDQFYFHCFNMLWNQFLNAWHGQQFQHENNWNRQFKWQLIQKQKSPIIKETAILHPNDNITTSLLTRIDTLNMTLILFEQTLKDLFKVSRNVKETSQIQLNQIQNSPHVQYLTKQLASALKEYQFYQEKVADIDLSFRQH